jgi:hypothetical protein
VSRPSTTGVQPLDLLPIVFLGCRRRERAIDRVTAPGWHPPAIRYALSLTACDCSDLLASDPLTRRPERAQVGTITTSEQIGVRRQRVAVVLVTPAESGPGHTCLSAQRYRADISAQGGPRTNRRSALTTGIPLRRRMIAAEAHISAAPNAGVADFSTRPERHVVIDRQVSVNRRGD